MTDLERITINIGGRSDLTVDDAIDVMGRHGWRFIGIAYDLTRVTQEGVIEAAQFVRNAST
jgi:hypothetical protein